jgi:imidazole glycerol-phosphate synthase
MGNIEEAEADGLWRPIAETRVSKRVIACLDVRSNDEGDLVVTKGDQYDVRERAGVRCCCLLLVLLLERVVWAWW